MGSRPILRPPPAVVSTLAKSVMGTSFRIFCIEYFEMLELVKCSRDEFLPLCVWHSRNCSLTQISALSRPSLILLSATAFIRLPQTSGISFHELVNICQLTIQCGSAKIDLHCCLIYLFITYTISSKPYFKCIEHKG